MQEIHGNTREIGAVDMTPQAGCPLSESASNVIENLACRVADRHGGRMTPNHLAPYVPLSLELIKACLDDMADGSSVIAEEQDNLWVYDFAAYRDRPAEGGVLSLDTCMACDKDQPGAGGDLLCPSCGLALRNELNTLAERTGWPAQAVYEHEILYRAAQQPGPHHAESLAGSSRYTLRSMRRKLDRLTVSRFCRQELDAQAGVMKYVFPEIEYPKSFFRKNMEVIRSYPASVMEEVQVKVVKILVALGLMVMATLLLAFWGIPFPLLVLLLLVAGPVVSLAIWFHRDRPEED